METRDGIARAAGLRCARGRAALDLAIARGLAVRDGTVKRPAYSAARREGGESTPHTPGTAGTASRAVGGRRPAVRDGNGTAWDGDGTAGRSGDATAPKRYREPGDEDEPHPGGAA